MLRSISVFITTTTASPLMAFSPVSRPTLAAPRANAYADGEPLGALPITSTIVPGALRVVGARPGA